MERRGGEKKRREPLPPSINLSHLDLALKKSFSMGRKAVHSCKAKVSPLYVFHVKEQQEQHNFCNF